MSSDRRRSDSVCCARLRNAGTSSFAAPTMLASAGALAAGLNRPGATAETAAPEKMSCFTCSSLSLTGTDDRRAGSGGIDRCNVEIDAQRPHERAVALEHGHNRNGDMATVLAAVINLRLEERQALALHHIYELVLEPRDR